MVFQAQAEETATNTMNNQQSHLNSFNHYIQNLNQLKKDLEKINKLTDPEEKYNQANISLSGHSTKFSLALGHYNTGKLWEISGCNQNLNEYSKLITELRTIETETFKQLKATQCAYCKKKNLTNPYVYKNMDGYKTVFCGNNCFAKWNEIQSKYTCEWCKQVKSGQYWYPTHKSKRIISNNKFCSEECLNQWQENKQSHKQERERESSPSKEQQLPLQFCPQCCRPLTGEWVWTEDQANDNLEFCSEECCDNFYEINKYCDGCGNVIYQQSYQWITWKDLPEEKNYHNGASVKELTEYLENQLNKTFLKDCFKRYCLPYCFCQSNGINEEIEKWDRKDWNNFWEWTKEEREGKAKQYSKQDLEATEYAARNKDSENRPDLLGSNFQTINNRKSLSQENNSNLLPYILSGITGVGLAALVVFLITRARKKE